jgi:hypothetical protein
MWLETRKVSRMASVPIALEPKSSAKTPAYPSHLDPPPHKDTLQEQKGSVLAAIARQLAVLALGAGVPACSVAQAGAKKHKKLVTQNPFSAKNGGFPIHPIHFGTGQPSRLSEAEALPVIERVFKQAGVSFQRGIDPKLPKVQVTLDGWNHKHRVGFEFVSWGDYEYSGRHRSQRDERLVLQGDPTARCAGQKAQRVGSGDQPPPLPLWPQLGVCLPRLPRQGQTTARRQRRWQTQTDSGGAFQDRAQDTKAGQDPRAQTARARRKALCLLAEVSGCSLKLRQRQASSPPITAIA